MDFFEEHCTDQSFCAIMSLPFIEIRRGPWINPSLQSRRRRFSTWNPVRIIGAAAGDLKNSLFAMDLTREPSFPPWNLRLKSQRKPLFANVNRPKTRPIVMGLIRKFSVSIFKIFSNTPACYHSAGPGPLKIKTANPAVHVQNFSAEKQPGGDF